MRCLKSVYNLAAELSLPRKYVGFLQKLEHTQKGQFPTHGSTSLEPEGSKEQLENCSPTFLCNGCCGAPPRLRLSFLPTLPLHWERPQLSPSLGIALS